MEIREGEHICYCPDGTLHLFPLHVVRYLDGYLAEKFTFSKVHHVYQLIDLLQNDLNPPQNFLTLVTPAKQDQESKKDKFYFISNWIKEYLPKEIKVDCIDADMQTINEAFNLYEIIHFSTHGVFPKGHCEDGKANPYDNSGLLLKDAKVLPSFIADFNYTQCSYLFSPKYITNKIKFRSTPGHVSLQACVSGRSKEGYGGDALGLEWALFRIGIASMLSANWDVDVDFANEFFKEFYYQWLVEKKTKAVAHQKAILKILHSELPQKYPAPYYWGAFTLSGDWR
jgi:CHAT domain-containing protein